MAYIRGNDPEIGKYRLLTAALDGRDEKILHIGSIKEFPGDVAWSPNGKQIIYGGPGPADAFGEIGVFDFGNGKAERLEVLTDKRLRELKWLPDGRGLLVNYWQMGPNAFRGQIGFLPATGKGFQQITRDTNGYRTLTVSADGRTLATVQRRTTRRLSLLPGAGSQSAQLTPLSSQVQEIHGFNWSADGDLLVSGGAQLWRMNRDGKSPIQLLNDWNADILYVSACSSRFLVFVWGFHEGPPWNLWRVNADGSEAVRLTRGKDDEGPVCSPDQKWVYYYAGEAGSWQIGRVPLDGAGKPELVPAGTDFRGYLPGYQMSISGDSKTLAYVVELVNAETRQTKPKIALLTLDSPASPRLLDPHPHISGGVQFTPDGKALAYSIRDGGVDNLWAQPIDGSAGHQITNFDSNQIGHFFWSPPDGKTLGLQRGQSESDVVLLQESKP